MIGTETGHSSHSSPTIIPSQCELGANPRLMAASTAMARNGKATRKDGVFRSPPERVSLVR